MEPAIIGAAGLQRNASPTFKAGHLSSGQQALQ
jgi:hypothetical protein